MARFSWGLLAALALAAPSLARAHDHAHMAPMGAATPLPGASLYNLEALWTDADGTSGPLASLRGTIAVAAMAYTTCPDMCPAIVADMFWIERRLPPELAGKVRFVFISIDSVKDTPERLKAYAADHGMDPQIWTLLHGDDDAVRETAAALGVRYRADGQGGFDHSAIITLLDPDGTIAFQQNGARASSAEFLEKLEALAARTP